MTIHGSVRLLNGWLARFNSAIKTFSCPQKHTRAISQRVAEIKLPSAAQARSERFVRACLTTYIAPSELYKREIKLLLVNMLIARDVNRAEVIFDLSQNVALG